jgi:DNA-binding NtrC family response regulator
VTLDQSPRLGSTQGIHLSGREPEISGQRRDVLLLEDGRALGQMLDLMLRRSGYRVTHVEDGDAAWESLRRTRPTVLITDMCHPGMQTLDLCHMIRADSGLRPLPIIVWSPYFPQRWEAISRELHLFSRYKPLIRSELIALIELAIASVR